MKKNTYYVQTELMLEILPFVMKERIFSLKGGTAINFFYQDMPRLSVDQKAGANSFALARSQAS